MNTIPIRILSLLLLCSCTNNQTLVVHNKSSHSVTDLKLHVNFADTIALGSIAPHETATYEFNFDDLEQAKEHILFLNANWDAKVCKMDLDFKWLYSEFDDSYDLTFQPNGVIGSKSKNGVREVDACEVP